MWKHCPKEINMVLGYRTKRSMKNRDTWKFAHDLCGRLWWRIGWVMLLVSVLAQIPFWGSSESVLGVVGGTICMVQCAVLVGSIFPVESALKRTFFDDGSRR